MSLSLPDPDTLIRIVKELRRRSGLSQEDLGRFMERYLGEPYHQSTISKIFSGRRRLTYEEAYAIASILSGYVSAIPEDVSVADIASFNLYYVSPEQTVGEVSRIMMENGFTQLPVIDGAGRCYGVITDLSLIKAILSPPGGVDRRGWVRRLAGTRVADAVDILVEDVPRIPADTPLREVVFTLLHSYAFLVEEEGKVKGIVTRADIHKLIVGQGLR